MSLFLVLIIAAIAVFLLLFAGILTVAIIFIVKAAKKGKIPTNDDDAFNRMHQDFMDTSIRVHNMNHHPH